MFVNIDFVSISNLLILEVFICILFLQTLVFGVAEEVSTNLSSVDQKTSVSEVKCCAQISFL